MERSGLVANAVVPDAPTVWTIGHSTRTGRELVDCLLQHGIQLVVDVRRFPGSRRLPQFAGGALAVSLLAEGIDYCWIPALGGRRRASGADDASAWRHPAFRAYAEHLVTDEFSEGLMELAMLAGGTNTVIMCAEVLWWRCHRRLISDVLLSVGFPVVHIYSAEKAEPHRLTDPARLRGGVLTYERTTL